MHFKTSILFLVDSPNTAIDNNFYIGLLILLFIYFFTIYVYIYIIYIYTFSLRNKASYD